MAKVQDLAALTEPLTKVSPRMFPGLCARRCARRWVCAAQVLWADPQHCQVNDLLKTFGAATAVPVGSIQVHHPAGAVVFTPPGWVVAERVLKLTHGIKALVAPTDATAFAEVAALMGDDSTTALSQELQHSTV